MKNIKIISVLFVGLIALLASGCATVDLKNQKKNVQFEQVTPSSTEVELQTGPQGTVVTNKSGVVSQSQPVVLATNQYVHNEVAGTTKYSDTSSDTSKHFSIDSPLKGLINAAVFISVGQGGGYDDGIYYQQSSYGVERDNYRRTQSRYSRGGNRPYPQNTGDGRIHRRQERPRWQPNQYDRYGNFRPAGYYYSNGYSYPTQ